MKGREIAPEQTLSDDRAADVRVLAKGGAVQIIGQLSQRALSLVFVAVFVRLLGFDGYGVYREVFQVVTIGTILAGGFADAALRYVARARSLGDHGGVRGAARVTLFGATTVSTLVALAVVWQSEQIASAFAESAEGRQQLTLLLRVAAAYVPLYGAMQVLKSCTQAYKTMVPGVMIGNVIQPLARLVLGIAAVFAGFAVIGAIAGLVVSAALGTLAGAWYFRRLITPEERRAKPAVQVGPILRFTLPQTGVSIFSTQSLGLGVVIVAVFASDRAVGLYGAAQSLQLLGGVFLSSIVAISSPVIVDIYERRDMARLQSIYQTINRWVATFAFPTFAALLLEPDFFARLLGGDKGVAAASLIAILAAGNLFNVGTGPSGYLLSMTGRAGINFFNSVVAVGLYIGLGLWLARSYGPVGMAIVDAVVTALVNVARVVEGWILLRVQPFGRSFLKPVAATVAATLLLVVWKALSTDSMGFELLGLALAGLAYIAILRAMRLDPEEQYVFATIKARVIAAARRRTPEGESASPQ